MSEQVGGLENVKAVLGIAFLCGIYHTRLHRWHIYTGQNWIWEHTVDMRIELMKAQWEAFFKCSIMDNFRRGLHSHLGAGA
jgi:hypothetical protein